MKLQMFTLAALLAAGSSARADDVVVNANHITRTYDCDGGDAVVNGNYNQLKLRDCEKITINGDRNEAEAADAEAVMVNGNDNRVRWTDDRPRLTDNGRNNRLEGRSDDPQQPTGGRAADGSPTIEANSSGVAVGDVSVGREGVKIRENPPDDAPGAFIVKNDAQTLVHDCKGADAEIQGARNTVRLTDCRVVTIRGDRNTVRVDGVEGLKVKGDANTVSWSAARTPDVDDEGDANTIQKR